MKKRLFAIILAVLIAIQCASAYVIISSTPRSDYNAGEAILVSGYVSSVEGMSGFLRTSIECESGIYPSSFVPITIHAGERLNFPSQVYVPPVIVSSSLSGLCHVNVGLVEAGIENDYAVSKDFEISKGLKANFRIQEKNLQTGIPVVIKGAIARIDNTPLTGVAEIYNVFGGTRYLVSVVNVENGNFSFTYPTNSLPAGEYAIEVFARDMYGNEDTFEAASYVISDKLELTADADKKDYLPGDEIIIQGELRNVLNALVSSATAYVSLDGAESAAKIINGKLEQKIILPNNVKSGEHSISISASDELGNSGAASVSFFVMPVATSLKIDMDTPSVNPLQDVAIFPKLLDQANDLIETELDLEIDDAKGNPVVAGKYASGKKIDYVIQQHAPPGEWEIALKYGKLKAKSLFSVAEVKDIKIEVSGTRISFFNTGNVKWTDNAELKLTGEQGTFTNRFTKNIAPGETLFLDLGKQALTGTYTLTVTLPDTAETFENFSIPEGKKVYSLNIIYILMLLLVVGLIAYELTVLLKRGTRMTPRLDHDDLRRLSRKSVSSFDAKTAAERERQKMVDDYKRMTLEEIKKTEAKMKPLYPDRPWRRTVERRPASPPPKKDEGSGAANFFGAF
ncbi:MAG: hypothetical protein AABX27_00395 [Nanoarchaeota archaeon]